MSRNSRMRFRRGGNYLVELRPSISKSIYLVRSGNVYDLVLVRLLQVDIHEQHFLSRSTRLSQSIAVVVDYLATTDELPTAFDAASIDRYKIEMVFTGAGVDDELRGAPGAGRPVC